MSRTTTDDCVENCPNHFSLAYHAAQRAQQILRRGDARVPEGDDRYVVVALREIAKGLLPIEPMLLEKGTTPEEMAALTASESTLSEMEQFQTIGAATIDEVMTPPSDEFPTPIGEEVSLPGDEEDEEEASSDTQEGE